jgi:hypothetical protein
VVCAFLGLIIPVAFAWYIAALALVGSAIRVWLDSRNAT